MGKVDPWFGPAQMSNLSEGKRKMRGRNRKNRPCSLLEKTTGVYRRKKSEQREGRVEGSTGTTLSFVDFFTVVRRIFHFRG